MTSDVTFPIICPTPGPGITQSDVLVVNKTDLAEAVGASLEGEALSNTLK